MSGLVIIGGGAAGLMAAAAAAEAGAREIIVIEKKPRPARKVMITGKGRCNLTNNCEVDTLVKNTLRGGKFMYSAFCRFNSQDTMAFFEKAGVPLKTERGNRVFPVSDKAVSIVDALIATAKKHAKIVNDTALKIKTENGTVKSVICEKKEYPARAVILATGGNYYSLTGSTGDGYKISRALSHTVTEIAPSLTGLVCKEGLCEKLAGLTLKNVCLSFEKVGAKKAIYKDTGELLFTHKGISGPLVLTASAYMESGATYKAVIDLKPGLDKAALDKRILRDFKEFSNRTLKGALAKLLPAAIIPAVISFTGIDPATKVNQITAANRAALIEVLKGFILNIVGTDDPDHAVITRGGVETKEINPADMQSKIVKGLYFAGEVMNVDALTGGFNLQIAFSSGHLAGISAAKQLKGE